MAGYALPCIYKGIEHEDSADHGPWTVTIGHYSLETIEKMNSLESPKLCLGMVSSVAAMEPQV